MAETPCAAAILSSGFSAKYACCNRSQLLPVHNRTGLTFTSATEQHNFLRGSVMALAGYTKIAAAQGTRQSATDIYEVSALKRFSETS
jgi:hypothetical protein